MADTQKALEHFGQLLMKRVRDEAIADWDMILDGGMKDEGSARIRAELERHGFTADQLTILAWLVPKVVDSTLHHLLWTLEQDTSVDVAVKTDAGAVPSLREVSDGLSGDLYGWIPEFSKQRYEEP